MNKINVYCQMTGVENNIIEVGLIDYLVNGRPRGPDERPPHSFVTSKL